MTRRLFTIAAVVSFLLFAGTIVLWVRSYRVQDEPTYARRGKTFLQLTSRSGNLWLDVMENWPCDYRGWPKGRPEDELGPFYCPSATTNTMWERWGVALIAGQFSVAMVRGQPVICPRDGDQQRVVATADQWPVCHGFDLEVPLGYCAAAFAIPSLIVGSAAVRRRIAARYRRLRRLCRFCGYDLRATNERCPECGSPMEERGKVT